MPAPRIHIPLPLSSGAELSLPPNATRHVQVLRLQPGAELTLFNGLGGEWAAELQRIGRRDATARVLAHRNIECELRRPVTLALGMPANERMDALIEKATELGVAAIRPLVCERSVLRVSGERAERKRAHWQAVAAAACEQCGRNHLPVIAEPTPLRDWLGALADGPGGLRLLLSLHERARPLLRFVDSADASPLLLLSGPEGGLSADEQADAVAAGFSAVSLGRRVLRADTAPLAALACLAALEEDLA